MTGCRFQLKWLEMDKYKLWLSQAKNENHARCMLCQKEIVLSGMGESALGSHASGKKHQSLIKSKISSAVSMKAFFTTPNATPRSSSTSADSEHETIQETKNTCKTAKANTSSDISSFVSAEDTLKAEIIWTLFTINRHHSFTSNSNINKYFQRMFPDSEIAKRFRLSERKTSYLACFGLAPYFSSLLEEILKNEAYVICFDESMNKAFQTKQMDFHIRVWDSNLVKTRYFTSRFLGHATALDMMSAFEDATSSLNRGNLLQLSMDGPNVNWSFHDKLNVSMQNDQGVELLNVGSCVLHKVHGAAKAAMEATSWNLDKFLKSLHKLFEDTPARREDFTKATGSSIFPLRFCKHRWLENSNVAQRALELVPSIEKYLDNISKGQSTPPKTESFEIVKAAIKQDKFLQAKLAFFVSICRQIEPFLKDYQTDRPMLPFMYSDLHHLTFGILRRFVKENKLGALKKTSDILSFNVTDSDYHLTSHSIEVGFVADSLIKSLKKNNKASDLQILNFKSDCKTILIGFSSKFLLKSPLLYSLVRDLACLDPLQMLENKACSLSRMKRILHILVNKRKLKSAECDQVLFQFSTFIDTCTLNGCLSKFNREHDRLDSFFIEQLGSKVSYVNIWKVVKDLLLLSHGQASVERGFSVNKELEECNMAPKTLIAKRIILDSFRQSPDLDNFIITPKLLVFASSAHRKYCLYLDSEKGKSEQAKQGLKRKALDDALGKLKKRKISLEQDIKTLGSSADEYALQAEQKRETSPSLQCLTASENLLGKKRPA
ncbi:uncharacterized protein LOC131951256 [Physella acuta]|uniref:uncharacterized protein LOC131951256 n=1 Tax=Physella acuta TaxID=109671 RepID=UPI0027DE7B1A|nr:uncharacterized protein LOC131951256 [Physella acuta]